MQKLLKSPAARWKLVRAELLELASTYADPRRTRITAKLDEPEFDAEAFIVDEDAMVVVTEQGWVKRQQRVKDVASTRVRKGDRVLAVLAGSTKSTVAFFSSHGVCYVSRIVDIAATTGHGTPLQTMFKMADGERIVGALGFDPRFLEVPPRGRGVRGAGAAVRRRRHARRPRASFLASRASGALDPLGAKVHAAQAGGRSDLRGARLRRGVHRLCHEAAPSAGLRGGGRVAAGGGGARGHVDQASEGRRGARPRGCSPMMTTC